MGTRSARVSVDSVAPLVNRGWALMRERQWQRARDVFDEAATQDEHAGVAWEGLAGASMCLDDFDRARAAFERAFLEAQAADDWQTAARAAMRLAVFHESYRGETAIANGWLERARTLLADRGPVSEHAWLALWEAHITIHLRADIVAGRQLLARALEIREVCPADVEFDLLASGLSGLVAIGEGSLREGMRQLDEMAAAAMSELPSPVSVGWASCYVLDACERARDFDRAQQWLDRAFIAGRQLAIPHFIGFCRCHFLGVLVSKGDYAAAERELDAVRDHVERAAPVFRAYCDVRRAEIRMRQGDLDAAEALLEPHRAHPLAIIALAGLALQRGRPQLAVDLSERYLRRVVPEDRVRRLHGLEPLVRAHVALGHTDAAEAAIEEISALAGDTAVQMIAALVSDLKGLAARARGDVGAARRHLEDAVDGYELSHAAYEATAVRLALAAVLRESGRGESADAVLDAARRGAEQLGARLLVEEATRAVEAPVETPMRTAAAARAASDLTDRELEVLALVAEGVGNQEIGKRLCISAFTVKRHVANILTKLEQPSRAAAAAYAIREGLL